MVGLGRVVLLWSRLSFEGGRDVILHGRREVRR